ncbi:trichohyalin [Selaginella moellendorffii]|uniref:trichohyalin n=1 Tax=Selaginella moellendorffii TaxID=88036 RepID=UPI000D1D0544|nr:trichohyalin [Selaginella moellendorffii]|eukprot:XP_024521724.1 trichohyalin [Selaginella moellendorffii]
MNPDDEFDAVVLAFLGGKVPVSSSSDLDRVSFMGIEDYKHQHKKWIFGECNSRVSDLLLKKGCEKQVNALDCEVTVHPTRGLFCHIEVLGSQSRFEPSQIVAVQDRAGELKAIGIVTGVINDRTILRAHHGTKPVKGKYDVFLLDTTATLRRCFLSVSKAENISPRLRDQLVRPLNTIRPEAVHFGAWLAGLRLNHEQGRVVAASVHLREGFLLAQGRLNLRRETIVGIVSAALCATRYAKILVCAPYNNAVDQIALSLSSRLLDSDGQAYVPRRGAIVRVGPMEKIDRHCHGLTLEGIIISEQRAYSSYYIAEENVLSNASVVCTTLSCSDSFHLEKWNCKFDLVLIDDAAGIAEAEILIALAKARDRCILLSDSIRKCSAYRRSLFHRLEQAGLVPYLLERPPNVTSEGPSSEVARHRQEDSKYNRNYEKHRHEEARASQIYDQEARRNRHDGEKECHRGGDRRDGHDAEKERHHGDRQPGVRSVDGVKELQKAKVSRAEVKIENAANAASEKRVATQAAATRVKMEPDSGGEGLENGPSFPAASAACQKDKELREMGSQRCETNNESTVMRQPKSERCGRTASEAPCKESTGKVAENKLQKRRGEHEATEMNQQRGNENCEKVLTGASCQTNKESTAVPQRQNELCEKAPMEGVCQIKKEKVAGDNQANNESMGDKQQRSREHCEQAHTEALFQKVSDEQQQLEAGSTGAVCRINNEKAPLNLVELKQEQAQDNQTLAAEKLQAEKYLRKKSESQETEQELVQDGGAQAQQEQQEEREWPVKVKLAGKKKQIQGQAEQKSLEYDGGTQTDQQQKEQCSEKETLSEKEINPFQPSLEVVKNRKETRKEVEQEEQQQIEDQKENQLQAEPVKKRKKKRKELKQDGGAQVEQGQEQPQPEEENVEHVKKRKKKRKELEPDGVEKETLVAEGKEKNQLVFAEEKNSELSENPKKKKKKKKRQALEQIQDGQQQVHEEERPYHEKQGLEKEKQEERMELQSKRKKKKRTFSEQEHWDRNGGAQAVIEWDGGLMPEKHYVELDEEVRPPSVATLRRKARRARQKERRRLEQSSIF